MMPPFQTVFGVENSAEASPFVVEYFMVQGLGYRGMAYCDQDGNWRNAFNNDKLMGNIYLLDKPAQ